MNKTCTKCETSFEVTDEDLSFYKRVSPTFNGVTYDVPTPTYCPDCRFQRRAIHRNQLYLNVRKADNSGEQVFSIWPPKTPFPVYDNEYYRSDKWNALNYGREVDFNRPFLEQLQELFFEVPRPARSILANENSDYVNNSHYCKNCYLCFGVLEGEDCIGLDMSWYHQDVLEGTLSFHCELCYDLTSCKGCYGVQSSQFCTDCKDSYFLMNCRNCINCFGCVNLRHSEYCMFNEQLTKEEYERRMADIDLSSHTVRQQVQQRCFEFFKQHPRPHMSTVNALDATGNYINDSKSVHDSFLINDGENLKYCFFVNTNTKDCMDVTLYGNNAELLYEDTVCGTNIVRVLFSNYCFDGVSDAYYCNHCERSSNLFGCASVTNSEYCILNKQYSKEQYEALAPKIIEHMKANGEWGEFFPINFAALPYNQTIAQRSFPLTKQEAETQGYNWHEHDALSIDESTFDAVLDGLPESNNPLTFKCEITGRPFRVTSAEIVKCKQMNVPLPRTTYDTRMNDRFALLGERKLYERTCDKTGVPILTTIPPDSGWIVWDKDVYEQEFSG